jgi:NNP family nitrate/nitrite transporter-like MFS transporter
MRPSLFSRRELISLLFLTLLFYLNFLARVLPSPLGPVIEEEFAITHGAFGLLIFLLSAGFFCGMLGAGLLAGRVTHRQVIILSTLTMGATLIGVSFAATLWQLQVAIALAGLTTGAYLPSALPTLTSFIEPTKWGKAIAIHELAPSLAFISAPVIAELVLLQLSWRAVFLAAGLAAIATILIYCRFGQGGRESGRPLCMKNLLEMVHRRQFWTLLLLFSLGICSSIGIYSMLPLFLVEIHGLERSTANTLLAVSRVATLGTILLGGWAADRFGTRRTIGTVLACSGSVIALLGATTGNWLFFFFFLQPMLAVCFFPAAYSALSASVAVEDRPVAIALTLPTSFLLGAGAIPTVIGYLGDFDYFQLGFILAGAVIACGGLACLLVASLPFQPRTAVALSEEG